MNPTTEIEHLIDQYILAGSDTTVNVRGCAKAIAASLFVGLVNTAMRQYTVPGLDGAVHLVQLSSEPRCWQKYSGGGVRCPENEEAGPCWHIEAVRLWKARQGVK